MPANVVFFQNLINEIVNLQIISKENLQKKLIEPVFGAPAIDNSLDHNDNGMASQFKS